LDEVKPREVPHLSARGPCGKDRGPSAVRSDAWWWRP